MFFKHAFFMGLVLAFALWSGTFLQASEIRVTDGRVVVSKDDGTTIDTAKLPEEREVVEGSDIEINEGGISIGSVANGGGEQKNIRRSTTLDNVTIINNDGKTTIYRKGKQDKGEEKKP